jgi:hypothetical protein
VLRLGDIGSYYSRCHHPSKHLRQLVMSTLPPRGVYSTIGVSHLQSLTETDSLSPLHMCMTQCAILEVVLTRNQERLSTLNPARWHTYDTIRQGPTHQDPKFWIFVIACTLRRFSLFRVSAASVPSARFQVGTPSRRHLLLHLDRLVRSVT